MAPLPALTDRIVFGELAARASAGVSPWPHEFDRLIGDKVGAAHVVHRRRHPHPLKGLLQRLHPP